MLIQIKLQKLFCNSYLNQRTIIGNEATESLFRTIIRNGATELFFEDYYWEWGYRITFFMLAGHFYEKQRARADRQGETYLTQNFCKGDNLLHSKETYPCYVFLKSIFFSLY